MKNPPQKKRVVRWIEESIETPLGGADCIQQSAPPAGAI